jgi:WXG100 family type VII secretion target
MIISGTIELDPAAHAVTTATLRSRLEQLEERRSSAERSVDRVLATWRGEAADSFRARWAEWNAGALGVIDQLTSAAEALDQVRRDLTEVDQGSAWSSGRIAGRLG